MTAILIENLHKKFGQLEVLRGLNLAINRGGVFAVLGPNGSGKTTLIKSILGMVIPDQGEIFIEGEKVIGCWEYRNHLNYLPQMANFPPNLTVRELFAMVSDLRPKECHKEKQIELFGLTEYLPKKLGHLSGGTKQKVNLALTFMFDSDLVILDEPTTGLDPIALIQLKKLIEEERQRGKTILVTTHIMSLVEEIAEEIVFLLDGKIHFQGSVDKLKSQTSQENLEHAIAHLMGGHSA